MTMRSTGKSPVVLYFKAISAESELLPSSSSCDLCCSPIPKDHHPPAYCLPDDAGQHSVDFLKRIYVL
ncbi:BnaC05g23800D [Brassica napus]|uniref:BnaC05g23800D protein n=1 Tax=Brassica napus TaxID=3708 RepID=A0A078F980_BRANA|nr:BnaC05g23800D [Brassica napus]